MEHGLHVLVRFDIDQTSARIEVSGCVTDAGCGSLFPVIDRTCSMTGDLPVTVDLSRAGHIDTPALERLQQFCATQSPQETGHGESEIRVSVTAPAVLPDCRPLDTEQAQVAAA